MSEQTPPTISQPVKSPLLPPPTKQSGKLVAAVLSTYDLPTSKTDPTFVSMSILGTELKTGPPCFKQRDKNNFRFVNDKDSTSSAGGSNELTVTAPLSALYPATAMFRVHYGPNDETLVAQCPLNTTLQINEQKWLILHLVPESTLQSEENFSSNTTDTGTSIKDDNDTNQPTLRLKLIMEGPYRQEIALGISIATTWFSMMDTFTNASSQTASSITSHLPNKVPFMKYLLIPTVPLAASAVALLPIGLGILVLGLPFFLPLLVVILGIAATILAGSVGVYLSSSSGRDHAGIILQPIYNAFCSTQSGQRLLYQTGSRPSPVALAEVVMPQDMMGKLVASLVIDFIGSSSYLLPGVGEAFDLAWAPTQTVLIMAMYDSSMPSLKYISFIEEIIPFTDLLPSATLGWVRTYSPILMEEGMRRVEDLKVVVRGETQAFRQE